MTQQEKSHASALTPSSRSAALEEVRTLFLSRVERAVRSAGVESAVSIAALRDGAIQLLDQMTTENARTGFALANSLTASQIRLVDDNQLELSIRLGDISKRLRDECSAFLYKFHQRFATLLDRPTLRMADNPLSPDAICRALAEMFGSSDSAHRQAIARLNEIETHLARELPLVYAELSELMVRYGVAPAKVVSSADEARVVASGKRGGEGGPARGDAMVALQQAVLSKQPSGREAGGGESAPRFEQILGQLDQWQARDDLFDASAPRGTSSVLHTLKKTEALSRLRAQDAVTLDVLSALFDALLEDHRLSPALKTAVARLQVPVLKSAILAPTFFNDPEHPARALLQSMGQAMIGLGPAVDADHPVCAELQRIASSIQSGFQRDPEVLVRNGAQLESFMARRNHELQGSAQGFIALAREQEKQDLAARAAWRAVISRLPGNVPRIIGDFLREHWTKVLAAAWLDGGPDGHRWRNNTAALDDLIWSIQPKVEPEERQRLGKMVPGLLARIKGEMDGVNVNAEARAPFLEACFAFQAAAIRGRTVPSPPPVPAKEAADGDILAVLHMAGLTLQSLRPSNPDARVTSDLVRELVIGDWVEFSMPDGSARCGRLCWISPEMGNPLFMNAGWDSAISVARTTLERQLASEAASTGATLSVFDNAIEKALHQSIPDRV
ncbi:MAG: DUF1631 domain-containing protein [Gammaproteobacteria bacterium]|nr:DUF1631 domain-containing protein [Gammaproteobacteria bacterium]MBU1416693.1 DUF1631 domain-containing protein [Gammaproteobacteria bacterium]